MKFHQVSLTGKDPLVLIPRRKTNIATTETLCEQSDSGNQRVNPESRPCAGCNGVDFRSYVWVAEEISPAMSIFSLASL